MASFSDDLLASLSDLPPLLVAGVVLLFMALETTAFIGLFAPGDPVVLVAGASVTDVPGFVVLVGATLAGALIGESAGYAIGRYAGVPFRRSRMGRWIGEDRWLHAEEVLARPRGGLAIVGSRFVAVVHAIVPVLAGTVGMPFRRFIGWAMVGSTLWSVVHIGIGAFFRAAYGTDGGGLGTVTAVVLVAGALLMLASARRPRRGRGSAEQDGGVAQQDDGERAADHERAEGDLGLAGGAAHRHEAQAQDGGEQERQEGARDHAAEAAPPEVEAEQPGELDVAPPHAGRVDEPEHPVERGEPGHADEGPDEVAVGGRGRS
jgi:membrane-associated protein